MIRYKNFEDLINRMVSSFPERNALLYSPKGEEVQAVTWAELAERVHVRADELARRNRACEAILADGSYGCVVEVFAAVQAGLQVALVDPLMPNGVMEPLLRSVDADCAWSSNPARQEEIEKTLAPKSKPAYGAHGVLFFTSGTTSFSKAVVLTDESLMSSAYNGSSLLPLSPDDTLLCLLPLSHVFGFVCGLLWGLSCSLRAIRFAARESSKSFRSCSWEQPTAQTACSMQLEVAESASAWATASPKRVPALR